MNKTDTPFVSIIVPILNEADFIEAAIQSILDNKYPAEKMEIIVVDGLSNDGTREIVSKMASHNSNIQLIDNPAKIQTIAMNIGIKACRGEIFIRIDGHAEIPPDFIRKSVNCLAEHPDAWIVGGYWKTVSSGYIGKVIAAATESPIGVGDAKHRLGNFDGWVDTLSYGAHHKWIIEKIGYLDEELARNEDDDFNMRVIQAGGKIWISSSIWSTYYARSSMRKLWRQYFQYGFWRIKTIQKHRRPAVFRQIVPLLFVLSLIVFSSAGFWWKGFSLILAVELGVYALALIYGTIDVARKAGWKYSFPAPLVFMILHMGYGIGSLWGIVRYVILKGRYMQKPEDVKLTR